MNTEDKLKRANLGDIKALEELIWEAFRKSDDYLLYQVQDALSSAMTEHQKKTQQLTEIGEILHFMDQNIWHPGHLDEEDLSEEEKAGYSEGNCGETLREMLCRLDVP